MESIFNDLLIKAARLTSSTDEEPLAEAPAAAPVEETKAAFVDAGMASGAGAPSGGGPAAAGGAPPDPSMMQDPAAAGGGGAPTPTGGEGDPVSGKLDQVLSQLSMLQSAPAAGGMPGAAPKPAGGGGGKKGGGEMQYNIILKLLARMCDALKIPVSLEELLTQEQQIAAFQAQAQAGGPAAPPAQAAPPAAGGSELMGGIQPPEPVTPLSSVTQGADPMAAAGGGGGGGGGGATKTSGYDGIAVTPETLRNITPETKQAQAKQRKPDLVQLLRGRQ